MSKKSVTSVQKTCDNAGGKHTRGFSLQHKTFGALNYAQDFGTTVKESLKRTTSSKWPTLTEKSNCPVSNTFMPLSALSTVSSIGANSDWIHQLNSKSNGPVLLFKGAPSTSVHCGRALHRNSFAVIQKSRTGFPCLTDSDQIRKVSKKVTFEVVYGRTCMTMSRRSVRDHDWCVWIYEAGVILMVIRLMFSVTNKLYWGLMRLLAQWDLMMMMMNKLYWW